MENKRNVQRPQRFLISPHNLHLTVLCHLESKIKRKMSDGYIIPPTKFLTYPILTRKQFPLHLYV